MKILLKWLGFALITVVALVAIGALVVYVASNGKLHKTYAVTVRPVAVPIDVATLERGRHIALSRGCVDCHGKDFAGGKVMDDGAMGHIFGVNLTSGAGGLKDYHDEDWVRAIRHGVSRDGHPLYIMPSIEYSHLSDADLGALIAYMKSLAPIDRPSEPLRFGPISRMLLATGKMKLSAELIDHAHLQPPPVTAGMTVEYGRYLAVACVGCHGPNYSGGKIDVGPPDWPPARNLTPHPSGNLAKWTQADFVRAIRDRKRPDGSELNPVMPIGFAAMNDEELGALWVFLKTLPPVATGVR
jgi:mono/diheme cytochrome c family protein